MNMSIIIVEGEAERALLARLLQDLASSSSFEFMIAGGREAARPLARQQQVMRRKPVVLVVDSDTTDEERVRTQQRGLDYYLAWGAGDLPCLVLQFVPEIEVIFFECPSVFRFLVGQDVDELITLVGNEAPRKVLAKLIPDLDRLELINKLRTEDLCELRKHSTVAKLREFISANGTSDERRIDLVNE